MLSDHEGSCSLPTTVPPVRSTALCARAACRSRAWRCLLRANTHSLATLETSARALGASGVRPRRPASRAATRARTLVLPALQRRSRSSSHCTACIGRCRSRATTNARLDMHEPWLDLGLGVSPHTGTTIVACVYDGGVVLGADTRVTTGARRPSHACLHAARAVSGRADRRCRLLAIEPRGPPKGPRAVSRRGAHPSLSVHRAARGGGGERAGTYISNRVSDKITPLADNAFLCRSGSAADTQLVSDYGARDTRARRASLRRVCHLGRPHARPRPRKSARSSQRGPPTHTTTLRR